MKYLIIFFGCLLLNGCGLSQCLGGEYDYVTDADGDGYEDTLDEVKKITIVNRTDKIYTNNGLYIVDVRKKREKNATWKMYYQLEKYFIDYPSSFVLSFQKIKTIKAKETIEQKNGKKLKLANKIGCSGNYEYTNGDFFVFSLDGGKRKIAFGLYNYASEKIWREGSGCEKHYTWDIHPVWQEKELTIHIYNDKITFSDPKIKEVKKVTASKSKEEIELKNLEIVPCDEE